MKNKFFTLWFFLILLSCNTSKNLIVYSSFEKSNLNSVPYYFNNFEKDFLKMEGDLLRVKYQDSLYLDMICFAGKNGLYVHVESDDINFDTLQIRVVSKNNNYLIKDKVSSFNPSNSLRFFKDFYLIEKKQRFSLLKNDTIKIQLPNKEYQFISALRKK